MLEIKALNYSYDDEVQVIDNIDLTIEDGLFTAILGSNGSGKSTLAKLIAGVERKDSGELLLDGQKLHGRDVSIVFQNPDNQFIRPIVLDDLAFGLENLGMPVNDILETIDSYAKRFKIEHLLKRSVSQLSGGEKQRVAIVGNLMLKPKVLILDESTDMLDPITRHDLITSLKQFAIEEQSVIIYITHDMKLASTVDKVVLLKNGQVIADEAPTSLFKKEELLRESRLEVPFNIQLGLELNHSGSVLTLDTFKENYELKS